MGLSLACVLALSGKDHLVDIALFPDQISDLGSVGHFLFTFFLCKIGQVYTAFRFMSTYFCTIFSQNEYLHLFIFNFKEFLSYFLHFLHGAAW